MAANNGHGKKYIFRNSQECCSEGRSIICHDDNIEASLINRSNQRLWSHLDRETGSKLWKAMESLGVVHKREEVDILERLEKMENQSFSRKGRLKESKISFQ